MEIIPLSEYQIQELARLYWLYSVMNIGIDIKSGSLFVQYIEKGKMVKIRIDNQKIK